jgi:hypothetical protein
MSTYKVQDNSTNGVETVVQLLQHFIPYAQKQLGFHKPVMISFDSDADNASKMLGRTGQYNPDDFSVSIYVDGRHPKDILRSLSHELVHHTQNCNGDFDSAGELKAGYAQENPAMRDAELDAYKRGNIIFRDFEDLIKRGKIKVNIDFKEEGEPKMSLKEWKNTEINSKLMDKWGYSSKEEVLEEGAYRGEDMPVYREDDAAPASGDQAGGRLPDIERLDTLMDRARIKELAARLVDQPAEVPQFVKLFLSMIPAAPKQVLVRSLRDELALMASPEKGVDPRVGSVEPGRPPAPGSDKPPAPLGDMAEARAVTLTIDEARAVARKIFERISEEKK